MAKIWSKSIIVGQILLRWHKGLPLNSNHVQQHERTLYLAANAYFGGWRRAIEAAGITYDDVKVKLSEKPRKWSKEKIIAEILRRHAAGLPMNSNFMQKNESAIYGACCKIFGGWPQAVLAAGLEYDSFRKVALIRTKEMIIEEIQDRSSLGEELNAGAVDVQARGLHGRARALFGSWDKALLAAGIDPAKVRRKRPERTKAQIILDIHMLIERGEPLNVSHMQNIANGLYLAAAKKFGSWELALAHAGEDYMNHRLRRQWSRESIIAEIRELAASRHSINAAAMQESGNATTYVAALKYFGSWDQALKMSGFDPKDIYLRTKWTYELVLLEIKARNAKQKPLNMAAVTEEYSELVHSASYHFGSWKSAVEAAGFDYKEIQLKKVAWSKEEVIFELRSLIERSSPLNPGYMALRYSGLYHAACNHFSSWDRALQAVGVEPREAYENIMSRFILQDISLEKSSTRLQQYAKRRKSHRVKKKD